MADLCDLKTLMPRLPVPALRAPLAGGGIYDLSAESPALMSMVVFFRGLHCQQCRDYLRDLEAHLPAFESRGVRAVALSCDGADRGERTPTEWGLSKLRVAYGVAPKVAREWGLFLTAGRPRASGMTEPDICCEPAVFLVERDGTLWFSAVQNMAFARPRFEDLVAGFDFLFERGYFRDRPCPARGELLVAPSGR
jgi:peroxiredoxin